MERLPDSELELMLILWNENRPIKASEAAEKSTRGWSVSTVWTLAVRLEERGFVRMVKNGRAKLFEAAVSREDYKNCETKSFFERFHNGSCKSLIASLVDTNSITQKDIEEIEEMLKRGVRHE